MDVSLLGTDSRIHPTMPVELLVEVDGKIVRASIDWDTIVGFVGDGRVDEEIVHHFIRHNRQGLELAIKANLYSHGVPLSRQLVLTSDDFRKLEPI
ncbi:MAG: hypothetical protein ABI794_01600 [Betaproteobacteria bacterium]